MILVAVAAFALLLAVVYLIGRPFVAPLRYERAATLEQLRADRERLLAQLRELDMDFETGKLGTEEYEKLRTRRLQQIEAATRAIREVRATGRGEPAEAGPPAEAFASLEALELELERRIAERKRALAELERLACPACGTRTEPEDRFCRRCGADLAIAEVNDG